ncbi:MAG: right-handed parallel beta-helix repeat-containing protein, partial [Planctomycetota bacterium]
MKRLVTLLVFCGLAGHAAVAQGERPFAFRDAPVASGETELIERLREMASRHVERTIRVSADHPNASDDNEGSRDAPVRTLERAAALAIEGLNAGTPTRIVLLPGYHSGKLSIGRGALNETGAATLLIIQGAGAGQSVLTGLTAEARGVSYAGESWRPVEGRPNVYVHDWPHAQAPYAGPWANDYGQPFQNLAARSELIAVNGRVLMPVNLERLVWVDPDGKGRNTRPGRLAFRNIEEGGLGRLDQPYTFAVCSHPQAPQHLRNKIFIRLPAGMNIAAADIRIGRPGAIIAVSRKNNIVIKDLSIRHAGGHMLTAGLDVNHCRNVLIENVEATWNNGCGLNLRSVTNAVVAGVTASDNGYKGLGGGGLNHVLFDRLTAARNCWRGLRGGFTGWDAAGFKMGGNSHDVRFVKPVFVGNHTGGLWVDVFCTDVVIESLFSYGNRGAGLWLELSRSNQGRYEVRNSVLARNGWLGLAVWDVANVWIHHNVIVDNGTNIRFDNGGRPPNEAAQFGAIRLDHNLVVDHGRN